jgi:hypothetical protein
MDTLKRVLAQRSEDLVSELSRRPGLPGDRARRFVAEAGYDLIESYRWQAHDLHGQHLAEQVSAQALLAAMHANGIANRLGMLAEDVWEGLRTFVPLVLRMAEVPEPRSGAVGDAVVGRDHSDSSDAGVRDHGTRHCEPRRSWRSDPPTKSSTAPHEALHAMLFPGRRIAHCEPPAA